MLLPGMDFRLDLIDWARDGSRHSYQPERKSSSHEDDGDHSQAQQAPSNHQQDQEKNAYSDDSCDAHLLKIELFTFSTEGICVLSRAGALRLPATDVLVSGPTSLVPYTYAVTAKDDQGLAMSIEHISFQQRNRPITFLCEGGPELDLNPPYQREEVWSEEQRVNLIKSILQGLPIGVIFLNSRDIMEPVRVVDGKQRILAIRSFLDGDLAVPREWFADEAERPEYPDIKTSVTSAVVTGLDLAPRGRRHFEINAIATYETRFETEDEERELYLRINFGGVPHTEADLARAAIAP